MSDIKASDVLKALDHTLLKPEAGEADYRSFFRSCKGDSRGIGLHSAKPGCPGPGFLPGGDEDLYGDRFPKRLHYAGC